MKGCFAISSLENFPAQIANASHILYHLGIIILVQAVATQLQTSRASTIDFCRRLDSVTGA